MDKRLRIAQEFANNIKNNEIKRIILFGSVARGEDNDDSDIDILIISNNQENLEDKISEEKYNIITKYRELISAHVISEKHYEETKNYSFLTNIRNEGIILG
ncbi:nucleotidyltransferase domain-containing protein (plasmid) [Methanosphaera sp. ISO3-F5]|uniref:nucleotidyltransferase domain-containing protein n=1 Tax=Methanosphaera sp. ISO3-F5 TaxID=1452353 RepID=UPI002B25D260|nr:nucleotidyltransferase domain-containing protein [Methanosphaera sp. ISO3-F5]WQH65398.1 nucleotidyltransferase domain-containing protein [Methanosphaera sp. ISO3-F5]